MHLLRALYLSPSLTLKKVLLSNIGRGITTTSSLLNSGPSYYDILGVKSDCSQKEIRAAYLELCKRHHPDKQVVNDDQQSQQQHQEQLSSADDASAATTSQTARFQRINEAYDCLSRERERSRYDYDLKTGNTGGFYYSENVDPQSYYRRRGYPRGNAQYYDNFARMHYGYKYKRPTDGQIKEVELFGTSFAVFIVASLIVASILQSYSQWLDAEMLKANTERKFELMSQMYQDSTCSITFEIQIRVYVVYRDWARRNFGKDGNITSQTSATNSDKEQVKYNLYKDNSARSRNKDLFREIDEQENAAINSLKEK